jgi:hypothetical protein
MKAISGRPLGLMPAQPAENENPLGMQMVSAGPVSIMLAV